MFTVVKLLGIAFFPPLTFTEVFRFLVTLLYIFGKKVIFSKFFDFWLQHFVVCEAGLVYTKIYRYHIHWVDLVRKLKIVSFY